MTAGDVAGRERPARGRTSPRPGWTEIAVGLAGSTALTFGLTIAVHAIAGQLVFDVFLMALSFIAAGGGFALAAAVRIRSVAAFGLRRTTARRLLVGLAAGVLAFALKFPVTKVYVGLTGDAGNPQAMWSTAAADGVLPMVLAFLLLGVLTPIGEELLFRGVITTALLRYGAVAGVLGSAVIFAVLHGNIVTALSGLIVGLVAGELRRRSDSVWPGVAAHITFNLLSNVLAFVVLPLVGG
ncbi:type II CAAX endopeptidase family protein [Saccharopolyspora sp. NPDC047091]|uniref:CPBP family intramembrane glutamic endopeptidase n=1 Tax=Saccharopolyspora sp. NPDC047091 TaxID=3155924 RepID=UPI0033F0F35F